MSKKMRKALSILLIVIGIGCLLYPIVSNIADNYKTNKIISEYDKVYTDNKDYTKEINACLDYNRSLLHNPSRFNPSESDLKRYYSLLNVHDGLMGYIEIPKIEVKQPIYHSTNDVTLSQGIGHYIGSSLPVGGIGSHVVLSGHTGMASKLMFTDLPKLVVGDKFYVTTYNTTYVYEVDQIKTVLPYDTKDLAIDPHESYCTLITCVPLGVNSHRLLVRGKLIESNTKGKYNSQIKKTGKVFTFVKKLDWIFIVLGAILMIVFYRYITKKKKQLSCKKIKKEMK